MSDFSFLANYETPEKRFKRIVGEDICKIDEALQSNDYNQMKKTHREMDGKYQACVRDWGKSMKYFDPKYGFAYGKLEMQNLSDNLELMKSKVFAFGERWNNVQEDCAAMQDVSVVVNNSNKVDVSISFEDARKVIEDMPGLTDQETTEVQKKIDELEEISREDISRKSKWEKIKPIIAFAMDKGVDVAITIMGLVMQMQLS